MTPDLEGLILNPTIPASEQLIDESSFCKEGEAHVYFQFMLSKESSYGGTGTVLFSAGHTEGAVSVKGNLA